MTKKNEGGSNKTKKYYRYWNRTKNKTVTRPKNITGTGIRPKNITGTGIRPIFDSSWPIFSCACH
jgi:hypothetical protein